MKHYLIYKIKNKLNGMIYVGKHVTDDINDSYMGSGLRIRRAIEKYGIENFEKTILFECISEEEMNKKEAEIVNEDFIARDDVYNIKLGGDGGWDYINLNNRNIGFTYANTHKLNNKGKHISKKLRNALIEGQLRDRKLHPEKYSQVGERNSMFGKHHSQEAKAKMSESHKGDKNPMRSRMWIRNPQTKEFKVWLKTEPLPEGWERGKYQPRKI